MDDWFDQQLHFAAADNDIEAAKNLIANGYSLNIFDESGLTPLHIAAKNNNIEMMILLLKAGADVNAHDTEKIGNTPLREVAGNCSYEVAKVLIDAGADPTIPGWMQITALHEAEARKKPDGIEVYQLLKRTNHKT